MEDEGEGEEERGGRIGWGGSTHMAAVEGREPNREEGRHEEDEMYRAKEVHGTGGGA